MKKVTIECEVEDFCPADCTALNPYRWGLDDTVRCLSVDKCRNLHKALQQTAELHRKLDAILEKHERAGQASAPTAETESGNG